MDKNAKIFNALSDKTRLRIINLLMEREVCVRAITEALMLPQSTVSRHLSYLKNTGWLSDRREGAWMYYSINAKLDALPLSILECIKANSSTFREGDPDKERLAEYLKNDCCR